jgi:peroxiredoxin
VGRFVATLIFWQALCSLVAVAVHAEAIEGEGLTRLEHVRPAPDFALPDVDGNLHRLSDYRGKVILVNFWATWCPPCRLEMPSMQRAWEKLAGEGVVMLAIDVGEDEETVFTFTADYPVEFPLLLDRKAKTIGEWGVIGLPTSFVVDGRGRVVYRAVGGREWDDPEILRRVRELLPDEG